MYSPRKEREALWLTTETDATDRSSSPIAKKTLLDRQSRMQKSRHGQDSSLRSQPNPESWVARALFGSAEYRYGHGELGIQRLH